MAQSPFQGNSINLRPFEPDDAASLGAYLNDPDLAGRRYVPWTLPEFAPLSAAQVQGIVQEWNKAERELNLAVVRREGQEVVGHAGCDWSWDPHCPSVSVVIGPAYQRQGYGSEALSLLLGYVFEHTAAHVVACWIGDWNRPALAFAAHHGFREGGRMRRAGIRQGQYYDVIVTDLLRPEWMAEGGHGGGGGTHAP
jgi:RimJ/RimL family protein N-acetyltransferase